MRTADIVAEALLDWKVDVIFGLPGDGINAYELTFTCYAEVS
jgi:pyruvate dehydrogenase (quinone)